MPLYRGLLVEFRAALDGLDATPEVVELMEAVDNGIAVIEGGTQALPANLAYLVPFTVKPTTDAAHEHVGLPAGSALYNRPEWS